jgi:tetratricopeptide (TPR) repeat protein
MLALCSVSLGGQLMENGKHEEARKVFNRARELQEGLGGQAAGADAFPPGTFQSLKNQADSHRVRAHVLQSQQKLDEAEAAFREVLRRRQEMLDRFPDLVTVCRDELAGSYHELGLLLRARGRFRDAAEAWGECAALSEIQAAQFPGSPHYREQLAIARLDRALALYRGGQVDAAETLLRQVVRAHEEPEPGSPALRPDHRQTVGLAYYDWGIQQRDTNRRDRAEASFRAGVAVLEDLVREFPQDAEYHLALGHALNGVVTVIGSRPGQREESRGLLERAVQQQRLALAGYGDPRHPECLRCLGNSTENLVKVLLGLKDHDGAARTAAELADIHPDDWRTCGRAADYLQRCAVLAERDGGLAEGTRQKPVEGYALRSRLLLQETAKRDPDHPGVASYLAWFLVACPDPQFRDPPLALRLAEKAAEKEPHVGRHRLGLGAACYRAGDPARAVAELTEGCKLNDGGSAGEHLFLAMAHWQLGRTDRARECYDTAVGWLEKNQALLEQDPDNAATFRALRAETAGLLGVGEPAKEKGRPPGSRDRGPAPPVVRPPRWRRPGTGRSARHPDHLPGEGAGGEGTAAGVVVPVAVAADGQRPAEGAPADRRVQRQHRLLGVAGPVVLPATHLQDARPGSDSVHVAPLGGRIGPQAVGEHLGPDPRPVGVVGPQPHAHPVVPRHIAQGQFHRRHDSSPHPCVPAGRPRPAFPLPIALRGPV